jgi:hypothetical protein
MPNENQQQLVQQNNTAVRSLGMTFFREGTTSITAGLAISAGFFPFEAYKKYLQGEGKTLTQAFKAQAAAQKISYPKLFIKSLTTLSLGNYKFYLGFGIFAANIVPTTTIQLGTDYVLQEAPMFKSESVAADMGKALVCGVTGAVTATVVENTIMQQQRLKERNLNSNPIVAVKEMVKHRGALGPWKSFSGIATRDAGFTLCMLWANPAAKAYVAQHWGKQYEPLATLGVALAGAAATHPVDTVSAQMQETHAPMSYRQAAQQVLTKFGGPQGFYRGFGYRAILFAAFVDVIPRVKKGATEVFDTVFPVETSAKRALPPPPAAGAKAAPN